MSDLPRSASPSDTSASRWMNATNMLGLIVAAGVLARVVQYAQRRPLFIDDVMLMLNIVTRGYRDLLRPLDMEQSAPPLFLWLQRFIVEALGVSDVSFTLLSFIIGLAVLPMAWVVARRIVDRQSSMLTVALLASSPPIIYYSTSAKQYEADIFIALALSWLCFRVIDAPERGARWVAAIAAGTIALALSMPALFVVGGVWCAWAATRPITASARGRVFLLASGALWGVTFVSLYVGVYSAVSRNDYMRRFWFGAFLNEQTSVGAALLYVSKGLQVSLFDVESAIPWLLIGALWMLMLTGVVSLVREKRYNVVALLTTPLLLAIAASALGQWIVYTRFMLYSAPFVCVLVAHGLASTVRRWSVQGPYREGLVLAGALSVLALPVKHSMWVLDHPASVEVSRELLDDFNAHAQPAEPVYVYARAMPLWTYYSVDWEHPDTLRVKRLLRDMVEIGPGSGNGPSRGYRVRHEGFERRYPFRGSLELVGISPGMELTGAFRAAASDSGWAENEAERIQSVASPTVWVAFAHHDPVPQTQLQEALARLGGRVGFADERPGLALYRYRFDTSDSTTAGRSAGSSGSSVVASSVGGANGR